MPAKSKAQRRVMAIAEHHPGKLYKRNRGLLKMGKEELHKYASTKESKLPEKKKKLHKKMMKSMSLKEMESMAKKK